MLIHVKHRGYLTTQYSLLSVLPWGLTSCSSAPPHIQQILIIYKRNLYLVKTIQSCKDGMLKKPKRWISDTVSVVSLWFVLWLECINLGYFYISLLGCIKYSSLGGLWTLQVKCCPSRPVSSSADSKQCWHECTGTLGSD